MDDLYKRLLEFTRDGVYRYTFEEGRVLVANQGLVDILDLDCTPEELVGRRLRDLLIYTEKEGTVRRALESTGEIHGFEYHFKTLKDEDKWVIHDSFILRDPATGQRVVEAIVKDITHRKLAEREIARERERLAVTLRSIGDGVIATDVAGAIVLLNRVAEELTGWRQEEAIGRPLAEVFRIINERTRELCENPVQKVLQSGMIVGLANHTALIARDGTERAIADSGAPIRGPGGEIIGVVLVFRDVTELRRAEEALQQKTRELEERNAELDGFVYTVSHDLKAPLVTIEGFARLMQRELGEDLHPSGGQYLVRIRENVARMKLQINDLLELARVGRERAPLADVDVGALAADILRSIEEQVRQRGIQVRIAPDLPVVRYHEVRMRQVLANLIENAVKFMGDQPQPRIDITREDVDDAVQITVRDNGMGIPVEFHDRVFEIFHRLPHAEQVPGTGLGLALVRRIVELHGGRIEVESEEGHGAAFHFTIPLARLVRGEEEPDE